ncbi:MAG: hypothetical protein IKP98_03410 [Bacilli bacterium]|nr:hypothetical protein [Bacilli bacterium]
MEIMDRIQNDLLTGSNFTSNTLYEFGSRETEKVKSIKEMFNFDYDYLEIFLDRTVFRNIAEDIDNLPYDERITLIRMNLIEYLVRKYKMEGKLIISLDDLVYPLLNAAIRYGKLGFRIHAFLDEVESVSTQQILNDMFAIPGLNMRGYTSRPLLTSKTTDDKDMIFDRVNSKAKVLELNRKFNLGKEREEKND